jgi:hypothetical protein
MPTDFFSGEKWEPWTLAQIYADLGSKGDVARALNINLLRVDSWIRRREYNRCPQPVLRAGPTDVYSIQEWRDFFAEWIENHKWLDGTCLEHDDKEKQMDWFLRAE